VVGMSLIVYSGSAQLAALSVWQQPAAVICLTVLALSLRFSLMTATLATRLGGADETPRWLRALLAFGVTDENYATAAARYRDGARIEPAYLATSGAALFVAWVGGTVAGVLAGSGAQGAGWSDLAGTAGAVFPMVFLVLVVLTTTTLARAFVAVLGAALGVVGALVLPPGWHIVAAGLLAAAAGPVAERVFKIDVETPSSGSSTVRPSTFLRRAPSPDSGATPPPEGEGSVAARSASVGGDHE
jgi:predicted branched-subunit amino acid permease